MSQTPSITVLDDLEVMLCAVAARLRRTVDRSDGSFGVPGLDPNDCIRNDLLECVSALDRLHAMLADEIERPERPTRIVYDGQTVLSPSLRVLPIGRAAEPGRAA